MSYGHDSGETTKEDDMTGKRRVSDRETGMRWRDRNVELTPETTSSTNVLRPFVRDYLGEPAQEG